MARHQLCGARRGDLVLAQAEIAGEEVWLGGVQALSRLAQAIITGMTTARPGGPHGPEQPAGLTERACQMMLAVGHFNRQVAGDMPVSSPPPKIQ